MLREEGGPESVGASQGERRGGGRGRGRRRSEVSQSQLVHARRHLEYLGATKQDPLLHRRHVQRRVPRRPQRLDSLVVQRALALRGALSRQNGLVHYHRPRQEHHVGGDGGVVLGSRGAHDGDDVAGVNLLTGDLDPFASPARERRGLGVENRGKRKGQKKASWGLGPGLEMGSKIQWVEGSNPVGEIQWEAIERE